MDYETLIFGPLAPAVVALVVYFSIVLTFDYLRMMLFSGRD